MYQLGRSVAQNDAEAVTWYRKAADLGRANAQYNLGFVCAFGQGVADSDDCGHLFRLKADGDSDRSRTAFR
jgi:TPR repeat protein